jgi:glycosyltransferase involved in cell wall biosynthesis
MKILFVYSGNGNSKSSIVLNQARSIEALNIDLEYYAVNDKGFRGYIKHIRLLRAYLRKNRYDIIHAHYGLCGVVSLLARKDERIVVSYMGDDLLGSSRPGGRMSIWGKLLTGLNRILSRRFYDYSIVKSEEMFRVIDSSSNVRICPNGVNLNLFLPIDKTLAFQKTGFSVDDINLIFVSDPLRLEKNFELARSAVEKTNNNSVRLHIIKDTKPEELKYYYAAADTLIMTSLHEGSPNVVKEAMACNCPVVSTNVGDVKQLIGNTEGCFIARPDEVDFAEKIKMAVNFRHDKKQTKGRERIIELGLDAETIAGKVIEVYEEVLKINNEKQTKCVGFAG